MRVLKESSPAEAVLEWLKAELNSVRFNAALGAALEAAGCDETLITAARLDSEPDNAVRWRVLKSYRAWLDIDFENYDWVWVDLDRDEAGRLTYVDYSYWNELSDGTRQVGRAAANVASGRMVFDVANDHFFSVAELVTAGQSMPPIIVVADQNDGAAEILEGHTRATGYLLADSARQPLPAIWGRGRV